MKFGGTSVANLERIRNAARHVARERKAGHDIAVVVSAMSGRTNELVGWCEDGAKFYDPREYDAVVASGEQVTAGLLAIVLQECGISGALGGRAGKFRSSLPIRMAPRRIVDIDGSVILDGILVTKRSGGHRRVSGRQQRDRPHHNARPRRIGHQRRGGRRGHRRRPLRHLY